jgi:membrane protein implicated in regulation of membrane protease activity
MGLWGMIIRAGPGGGALVLGWLSTFWGLQLPVIGSALLALAIAILLLPQFRVVDEEVKRGVEQPPG